MTTLEFAEWLAAKVTRHADPVDANVITSNDETAELEVTDPTGKVHLVVVT